MPSSQFFQSAWLTCATPIAFVVVVIGGCATESSTPEPMTDTSAPPAVSMITGEGLPNPTATVITNWGNPPEGRSWGSSAGIEIDPFDGNIWAYERCGGGIIGSSGVPVPLNCESNPVDPIYKLDRHTGEVLANFGGGVLFTPHGLHVDAMGNVWITDYRGNAEGTKGHQVHKFSPTGELLMSLGTPGQPGTGPSQLNEPNDVVTGPDGSIYVSEGHRAQFMSLDDAIESGATGRILKFAPDGTFIKEWGRVGTDHGEFRTPHELAMDSQGRLFVADRGNHRIEIFDQDGNYLDSRYAYGRISGMFITDDDMLYAIDSESSMITHPNWMNGVRIGHVDEDRIVAFIPPFDAAPPYPGAAGEDVVVDADGNVFAAEGPISFPWAGGTFTKYEVAP